MGRIVVAIFLTMLLGCTNNNSVTGTKCSDNNWRELGMQAAKSFKSVRTFENYVQACGSNLESGAKSSFIDGYASAIIEVCTLKNGYKLGINNKDYPEICPFEIRADFQEGYLAGRREYQDKMRNMKRNSEEKERRAMNKQVEREVQ